MNVSMIVAASTNNAIGLDGDLPWRLPDDLKNFRSITTGKPVIMGRKTFDSLPNGPLPGRLNVVLSRDENYSADGIEIYSSLEQALEALEKEDHEEVMVIGGGHV